MQSKTQDIRKIYMSKYLSGLIVCLFLLPVLSLAQVEQIWVLGDGEKVFRNNLNHPDKKQNVVWDDNKVELKGLYNEVLAFQIIVETGEQVADNVQIVVDGPTNTLTGQSIGNSTLEHGPGGTIEVFTQHYLQVADSTSPNWFYGSTKAAPKNMTGWIPDALIPSDALADRGGLPMNIEPDQNQGFWIDISLPRDQNKYPDGLYRSTIRILEEDDLVKEIPLEIELLPYYLSDENESTIWLFTSGVDQYYPNLSNDQVEKMLKFQGHRHRVDVVGGFEVHNSRFDEKRMNQYKPYLNGKAYTPANGYYGPGQGVGEKIFPIGMYGGNELGNTKQEVQNQSDLWVNWFEQNAPDVTYFWYTIDEPGEEEYDSIKELANWINSNPNEGSALPLFTTTGFEPELKNAIDIWAAYNGVNLDVLPEIRKRGGDHWFYNGNRPRYGSVILEAAAVDLRVNSWILYKYGINTHFIWHGTHWQHNLQGPKRHLHQNMYQNPLTFINDGMNFGNGDGIIFYPGHMPFYKEEDRGLNELIPSIRLKNIRRGQQDAALMRMVEEKIGREKVLNLINNVVPRALSEVSMDEPVPWSEHGDDYDKIRYRLYEKLEE